MPRKILGLSHLVYGTPDFSSAEVELGRLGYKVRNEQLRGKNPPEKAPFVSAGLAEYYQMKLLLNADKSFPPVELLQSADADPELAPVFQVNGNQIQLLCANVLLSKQFLEFLGLDVQPIEDRRFRTFIPTALSKVEYELLIEQRSGHARKAYLDGPGFTCLSLLTLNAKRLETELRQAFPDAEVLVGNCFEHKPFDKTLNIFFVRIGDGEIYELLS